MKLGFLKSKIHLATVTGSDLNYEGSIAIDRNLCREARFHEFERVDVYNVSNGARFSTYVIYGAPGEISLNGAAARMVQKGDRIIIAAYCDLEPREVETHKIKILYASEDNKVKEQKEVSPQSP